MYNLILPDILLYKVKYKNKPLTFVIQNFPISFVFPEEILQDSDYIFSYGIGYIKYWEEIISEYYKKTIYAFDCGVDLKESDIMSKHLIFCRECIGTDKHIYSNWISSGQVHTLKSKLKELGMEDKKIYLRFGIQGLYDVMPEVLDNKDNITGISFMVELITAKDIVKIMKILKMLNKDFILVSRNYMYARDDKLRNGKIKYTDGNWSIMMALTYVNKDLLDEYYIPLDQSNYKNGKPEKYISFNVKSYKEDGILKSVGKHNSSTGYYKYNNISPIIVLHRKIMNLYKRKEKA